MSNSIASFSFVNPSVFDRAMNVIDQLILLTEIAAAIYFAVAAADFIAKRIYAAPVEPIVELIEPAVVETIAEPEPAEPAAEPIVESAAEPPVEPIAEPVIKPAVKTINLIDEPIAEPAVDPVETAVAVEIDPGKPKRRSHKPAVEGFATATSAAQLTKPKRGSKRKTA